MKIRSPLLRSLLLALAIIAAVVIYAYGFEVTKVRLDETRDPHRQLQLTRILRALAERAGMEDIESHIRAEEVITPLDWEERYAVYKGATFNLAHTLGQMLYLRPRNKFEEFDRCYLVGGGTHPGSGLPTIFESGRIAANLISTRHGVRYVSKNVMV